MKQIMIITWANGLAETLGDAMNPLAMASLEQTAHAAMQQDFEA